MKIFTSILFSLSIMFISSCGIGGNQIIDVPKTPEQLRAELKQLELNTPTDYLSDLHVTLTPKEKKIRNGGLFRDPEYAPDGALIKGEIVNKATLAKFKDITVKISYYSQTKTLIETKSYIFYEYYEPNSTKEFSLRTEALPSAYASFSFEVTGATPVYN